MKKTQHLLSCLFFLGLVFLNFNVEAKTKPNFFTKVEKANVTAKGFKSKIIKPNMKMANVIILKNQLNKKKYFAPVTCTQTVTSMGTGTTIITTTNTSVLVEPSIGSISKSGDNLIFSITHAATAASANVRYVSGSNNFISSFNSSSPITFPTVAGSLIGGKVVSISGQTVTASGCQSDFSAPVNYVVPFDAPTNLTGIGISPITIKLDFNGVNHPTFENYEYRVAFLGGAYGDVISNLQNNVIIDTPKSAATTYSYQVRARYGPNATLGITGGTSDWVTVNVTTPGFETPTNVNATTGNCTQINLSWTAPRSYDNYIAESYDIYRSEAGGAFVKIADRYPNTSTSFTDKNLTSSTSYNYYMTAIYANGRSGGSNSSTASTSQFVAKLIQKSATQATIGWDFCSSDFESYNLFGSKNGEPFTLLGTAPFNGREIVAINLTQDSDYRFYVQGKTATSTSFSTSISTKTDILPKANNFKLAPVDKNKLNLTWTYENNGRDALEGFLIYKVSKVAGEPDTFVQVGTTERSYNAEGLQPGQQECYYIVARYGSLSYPTQTLCDYTCADPVKAFSSVESLSPTKVKLNWVPTTNVSPTDVVIEYSDNKTSWASFPKVAMAVGTFTDETLTPDKIRFYRAVTINKGTCKGVESEIFTGLGCPTKPQNVKTIGLTSTSMEITWNALQNASSYNIERSINNIVFTKVGTAKGTDVKFVDINLVPSTIYYYRISAENGSKCTSEFSTVTLESFATTCPTAPTGVVATAVSSKEIKFSFVDNAPDEEGFEVQISTDEKTWVKVGGDLPKNSTSLNVTTNILPETKYFFRVLTIGKTCKSDPSLTTSVITNPPAPTGLSAKGVKINQIDLTWTNTAKTASGIEIQKAANTDNNYAKDGETPATTNAYSSKGLNAATNYKYRVRYNSPSGVSDWSNIADATTIVISANEDNVLNNQITLSPVPATDFVTIKSEIAIAGKIEATIVNANGRTVSTNTFNGLNIGKIETINIQKLSQGIYFLEVKTNKGTVTKKFMKQ